MTSIFSTLNSVIYGTHNTIFKMAVTKLTEDILLLPLLFVWIWDQLSCDAVVSVGAALFLFQQLAGINAVVYYSTSVFRSAGITSDVAASALVGASNVLGMLQEMLPEVELFIVCICLNLYSVSAWIYIWFNSFVQALLLPLLWWIGKEGKAFWW